MQFSIKAWAYLNGEDIDTMSKKDLEWAELDFFEDFYSYNYRAQSLASAKQRL